MSENDKMRNLAAEISDMVIVDQLFLAAALWDKNGKTDRRIAKSVARIALTRMNAEGESHENGNDP